MQEQQKQIERNVFFKKLYIKNQYQGSLFLAEGNC